MIHLSFFVRKLSSAIARCCIYNRWRHNLRITCCASFIKEEINQGTLQTSALTYIYWETGTRNFNTEVEVYEVVFLCQFPVRQRVLREHSVVSACFDNEIVFCTISFRNDVVWNIRNGIKQLLAFLNGILHVFFEHNSLLFNFSHTGFGSLCLFLFTFFHQHANAF